MSVVVIVVCALIFAGAAWCSYHVGFEHGWADGVRAAVAWRRPTPRPSRAKGGSDGE